MENILLINRISKEHKVGDFLLKNGVSVATVPDDVLQIEGIWLTENCVASLRQPKEKLTLEEAQAFCSAQQILGIPLSVPSDVYVPIVVMQKLKKAGLETFKNDFYWSLLQVRDSSCDFYAVWNPLACEIDYFFPEERTWCYAVLELPD